MECIAKSNIMLAHLNGFSTQADGKAFEGAR